MKLLHMTLEGVRGVPDGAYGFAAPATGAPFDTILVTGDQDAGKTSFLRVLAAAKDAMGSYGAPPDLVRVRRARGARCRVTTTWLLSDADRASFEIPAAQQTVAWEVGEGSSTLDASPRLRRLVGAYSSDPGRGKFELFPATRSLHAGESLGARRPARDPAEGRLRLTSAPGKYAGLRALLRDLVLADAARLTQLLDTQGIALRARQPDALAGYREAIAHMVPSLRLATVEPDDHSARVWFRKRDDSLVELSDLSASEHQGVLFATTFRRYGLNHSIVLIDSPELHIHPRRQADFLASVLALGRDNQIIAATTAPELLATVRPEQILNLSRARAESVGR